MFIWEQSFSRDRLASGKPLRWELAWCVWGLTYVARQKWAKGSCNPPPHKAFFIFPWPHHTAQGTLATGNWTPAQPLQWKHGILTAEPPGSLPYTDRLLAKHQWGTWIGGEEFSKRKMRDRTSMRMVERMKRRQVFRSIFNCSNPPL